MTHCPECSSQIIITDENCPSCNFPVSKLRGLCAATLTQDKDMVAALIQMGADVNSIDQNGRTPLMIASFIGDVDIVEMLLAAGANPEFTNHAGESALSLAQTKDVERLLRRAIVVLKFSAARKKETEDAFAIEPDKVEEVPVEEVTPDIEEALRHLEPVAEAPSMTLDSTQPFLHSSEENAVVEKSQPAVQYLDSTQQIVRSLDSTQPIPITSNELEIETEEEEETFTELESDLEEDPLALEIDQFIQTELQDVQPAIVIESSNKYTAPTLDPIEESLTETSEGEAVADEIDEFIQTELQDVQPSIYFERHHVEPSLTLDPMESLLESPPRPDETEDDELLQNELFDVQPSIRFESKRAEPSLTLDPIEESLKEAPFINVEEPKHSEYLESELHATENVYQNPHADLLLESLDPTEQMLEESEHREIEIPDEPDVVEPVIEAESVIEPEPVIEVEPVVEVESVAEEPGPALYQSPPMQREPQKWEDWKQIEQAVAFAPWKVESDPLDYESNDEIELAQPIEEVMAPEPKTPEVPPQVFMNSTRTRNIAIGVGIAIFLIQILLFVNWPLHSRKAPVQTKVIQAPSKETKPVIPAPKPAPSKPAAPKPEPKVEVQKEIVVTPTPKPEPKVLAATKPRMEPPKKQAKVKYESEKSEPAPVTSEAVVKSQPVNDEKAAKARDLNNQGSTLIRAGKFSEGISLLEQAVHTYPKDTHDENYASALLNLGRAWRMAGRPDISIRLLEQRMKINIERDEVARELMTAKRQAVESGMGIRND